MSASDWIKMTHGLRARPEVVRISSALKADRLRTIGALYVLWTLADMNSVDGVLPGYSIDLIDEEVGWPGFAAAAASVGWLEETPQGVAIPNFARHNGKSAKRRAQDASSKASAREADKCPQNVRKRSGPEKRREEKTTATAVAGSTDPELERQLRGKPWTVGKTRAAQLVATHGPAAVRHAMTLAAKGREPGGLLMHILRDGIDAADIPAQPIAFASAAERDRVVRDFKQAHPNAALWSDADTLKSKMFAEWHNGNPA